MSQNFLFIGVDPSYIAYFYAKASPSSSLLDSCHTLAQAEEKLAITLYNVYIIDDSTGSITEILSFIRNVRRLNPSCQIFLISTSGVEFEKDLINGVLNRPLDPQQVDFLFQNSTHALKKIPCDSKELPVVCLVDSDGAFVDLLNKLKDHFPFKLKIFLDPKEAIQGLKSINPEALVVAQYFPGSSITGFDLVKEERKKNRGPFISALILAQDKGKENLDSRMQSLEAQINYVFHKPIYAYTFLESMKEALEVHSRQNYKVVILDDDEEFCDFVEEILKDAGIEVSKIHRSIDLFRILNDKNPDLLLLDLILPEYDGMNLLKTLRQDIAYSNLKIVIITASDESSTKLLAYSAKADEIIYKPIDPILFQKRILHFIEQKSLGRKVEQVSGMGSLNQLIAQIHSCLENENSSSCIALFEMTQSSEHKEKANQELIISIGNNILFQADANTQCFHYEIDNYALVFEKTSLEDARKKMEDLLNHLVQRESFTKIGFNCGLMKISKNYGNAEENLQAAREPLFQAKKKEPHLIQIEVKSDEVNHKKELVLVDEDQQLTKILKKNFESYGLEVTVFSDGKAAIVDLMERKKQDLPALIILERKLDAMDGIDIIIKTKEHFQKTIPFFILTYYGADRDVIEGIKEGALEYMTKPFNLSILTEKVLKTIYQK